MTDTTYVTDPPEWAVGEFISSAQRPRKVLLLAVGKEIAQHEKHKDFIRWVSRGRGYAEPGRTDYYNLNDEVTVELTVAGVARYNEHFKAVPSKYLEKLEPGSKWSGPLWELAQIWGSLMMNGQLPGHMPFTDMRFGIRRQA